jgi:hypothetical protein
MHYRAMIRLARLFLTKGMLGKSKGARGRVGGGGKVGSIMFYRAECTLCYDMIYI